MEETAPRKWLDPRRILRQGQRRRLGRFPEFEALFAELDRLGPARFPTRRAAAAFTGLSESTFRRHFSILAGMDWRTFGGRWRLRCARNELTAPFCSEKQIARHCGFGSTSAFTRAFKAEFGMTPSEFRNSLRPGDSESFDEELAEL